MKYPLLAATLLLSACATYSPATLKQEEPDYQVTNKGNYKTAAKCMHRWVESQGMPAFDRYDDDSKVAEVFILEGNGSAVFNFEFAQQGSEVRKTMYRGFAPLSDATLDDIMNNLRDCR